MTWEEAKAVAEDGQAIRRAGWEEDAVRYEKKFGFAKGNAAGYESYEPSAEDAEATDWETCDIPS